MRRIHSKLLGVDQGEAVLLSDVESGGPMWTGTGGRERRHSIRFSEPFRSLPAVHCALSMWDIDSAANARVEIDTENIAEAGFDVIFRTWGDTRIARARVRWMALGEVDHQDDWDIC